MQIIDYPFIRITPDAPSRPMLIVQFVSAGRIVDVPALIDSGASQCCLPVGFGGALGLDLTSGKARNVITAGGTVVAYVHDCAMRVWNTHEYRKDKKVVAHELPATPVYFIPGLQEALLGVSFFNGHVLAIDYKNKQFSISRPPAD